MSNELAGLLGDKYRPATHDYLLSNRRLAWAKLTEGWSKVGELTNHGEVMVVLEHPKAPAAPPPDKAGLVARVKSTIAQSVGGKPK
jgi:hypothetical protein